VKKESEGVDYANTVCGIFSRQYRSRGFLLLTDLTEAKTFAIPEWIDKELEYVSILSRKRALSRQD